MSNNLRDRIIDTAIDLFNKNSCSHVTMRDISDALNISPGNLTYYYKKKKDLIQDIITKQYEEYTTLNFTADVSIEELNHQFSALSEFREKYFFYFSNFSELPKLCPEILPLQIKVINEFHTLYNDIFINFVKKDIMKEELYEGQYEDLSISLLSLNMYGVQELMLLKEILSNERNITSIIWSLILPHLTISGLEMYNNLNMQK